MRDFHLPGRSTAYASNAMCATSHPLAVQVALEVLRDGGNAVDAAVTAALTQGLTEPAMTGIGGDAFALVWKPGEARPAGLNGSGRAPAALDAERLRAEGHASIGAESVHSVTIPGAVDAFDRMLSAQGTFGWDRALAPSIRIAREGHPVAPRAAFDWARNAGSLQGDARTHFLKDECAPKAGEVFAYPAQAEALELISKGGRDAFYSGPIAEDMVASLNALGGVHTMQDFADTSASAADPISTTYRGTELIELPPNGHGATAILMTNILEGFDLNALDPLGPERAHIEAEAARLAYDARDRMIADPDQPGNAQRLAHMLSEDLASALRDRIDPAAARSDLLEGVEALHNLGPAIGTGGAPHRDTIYIAVVDGSGMMVSLIYSIFSSFGSGLASQRFGINFQNRGCGFTLQQGHPNELKGGKRPLHTIIPAMLAQDGVPWGCLGVMGGPYQPNGHARVLSNLVDYGMDPQAAIDAPRSFWRDGVLEVERGYGRGALDRLGAMGHDAQVPEVAIGGAQIILREGGVWVGGSDARKDGLALGF